MFAADSALPDDLARLGREAGLSNMVKLEVLGDKKTLLPDPIGTLEATKVLVADGFDVLVYTSNNWIINPLGWLHIRLLSWLSYVY